MIFGLLNKASSLIPTKLLDLGDRRMLFWYRYLGGQVVWDTQITPPEIIAATQLLPPGRVLDLGCGTGTNSLYLAHRGWRAIGVDFVPKAIRAARRKAKATGLRGIEFHVGDVTQLDFLEGEFDLALDVGCLHCMVRSKQPLYAAELIRLTQPGSMYLLYSFAPRLLGRYPVGLTPSDVRALLGGAFEELQVVPVTTKDENSSAYWYTFRRK
jgi:ubiquinone/menaquinone biosynthesis C-methylase UbiE